MKVDLSKILEIIDEEIKKLDPNSFHENYQGKGMETIKKRLEQDFVKK